MSYSKYNILDEMFSELKEVLNTKEFACHKIKNGVLTPVYKNDTDEIGLKRWIEFHSKSPITISENGMLTEIKETGKSISVDNLDKDPRNYSCFIAFNIKSIYVIPVLKENKVVAYIVLPTINEYYTFTEDKKEKCEEIIKKYNNKIIDSKILED